MLLLTIQIEMAKPRADTKVLPFINIRTARKA